MGRTPKPLKFLVQWELEAKYPWHELVQQGHTVVFLPPEQTAGFDLILGPNCWRLDETLLPYLDLAIKAARGIKFPKGKK